MGTAGSHHDYSSLWKGMVIPNGRGEPRQHAGEDGGDARRGRDMADVDMLLLQ